MYKVLAIGSLLAFSTSSAFAQVIERTPYTLSASQVTRAQDAARRELRDPFSAHFGEVLAARNEFTGSIEFCGTVNAKNLYGAYVGDTYYAGLLSEHDGSADMALIYEDGIVGESVLTICDAVMN